MFRNINYKLLINFHIDIEYNIINDKNIFILIGWIRLYYEEDI
jgi:hypothetical protein